MRIRIDARKRYDFDRALFSPSGHLVLESIRQAHVAANRFNSSRHEAEQISPAELHAAGLVHDLLHYAISEHGRQLGVDLFARVLQDAQDGLGRDHVERTLERFADRFPTDEAFRSDKTPKRRRLVPHRRLSMLIIRLPVSCRTRKNWRIFFYEVSMTFRV